MYDALESALIRDEMTALEEVVGVGRRARGAAHAHAKQFDAMLDKRGIEFERD